MLIELYGRNFGCFRDNFQMSLLATDIDPGSDRGIIEVHVEGDTEPLSLLRTIAIYGPNGAGKSTVLRVAEALEHLISKTRGFASDMSLRPYEPFALGPESKLPVMLGVKAVVNSRVYDYSIEFDRKQFFVERLIRLSGDREEVLIDRNEGRVDGSWTSDPQFRLVSTGFRPNALLLSLADSLAPNLAEGVAVGLRNVLNTYNPGYPSRWPFVRGAASIAKRARTDLAFNAWLNSRLRAADIGVVDMRTDEIRTVVEPEREEDEEADGEKPEPYIETSYRLSLLHSGREGPVALPYSRESLGTRRLVDISPVLFDLAHTAKPTAVFVDELDASMHPQLLEGLIRHFNCEISKERVRGQLIFATHETSLMDDEAKQAILRRDQYYFTAKDASGAARLYSLAEFRERNNLNIRRRYLQGRYGALPSLGTFSE